MKAGTIVVGQRACGMEAESLIQVLGGGIRSADFQAKGLGTSATELVQDSFSEAGTEATSTEIGMHG